MPVTAVYAALLAPLFVYLSVRVIGARRAAKVALGDGGDAELMRRMRVQANFAEYVPFALVMIGLTESLKTAPWLLHLLGVTLVAGRCLHAYGVSHTPERFAFRVTGMATTFTVILLAALICLITAGPRAFGF